MKRWGAIAALLIGVTTAATVADEAAEVDARFGAKIKAALATRTPLDDVVLAGEMVEAAKRETATPKLLGALCERAFLLAQRDETGFDTAIAALRLRGTYLPETQAECAAKALTLTQRLYLIAKPAQKEAAGERLVDVLLAQAEVWRRAGNEAEAATALRRAQSTAAGMKSPRADEIKATLDRLEQRQRSSKELAQYKDALKKDPGDRAAALALVKLYMIELDNPAEAAKHTAAAGDAEWKLRVDQARGPTDKFTDAQFRSLADWYREQAKGAPPPCQAPLLQHAHRAYMQFVIRHPPEDPERKKVEATVAQIGNALANLHAEVPPAPGENGEPVLEKPAGTFFGLPTGR
jgi:hypothetical protein